MPKSFLIKKLHRSVARNQRPDVVDPLPSAAEDHGSGGGLVWRQEGSSDGQGFCEGSTLNDSTDSWLPWLQLPRETWDVSSGNMDCSSSYSSSNSVSSLFEWGVRPPVSSHGDPQKPRSPPSSSSNDPRNRSAHPLPPSLPRETGSGEVRSTRNFIKPDVKVVLSLEDGRRKKKQFHQGALDAIDSTYKVDNEQKTGNKPSGSYECSECGRKYATSSNLSRHRQTHRSLDGWYAKHCPHCRKAYVSMPALAMHVLTHDLKYR